MFVFKVARGLRPTPGRESLILALVVGLGALAGGCYLLWRHAEPTALAAPEYWLQTSQIEIVPEPAWLSAHDLRQEVLRDASLDGAQSILDEKLAERIGLAFAAHPWVESVERVEKFHPARVAVRLIYREPAASVVIGTSLVPVDRHGVILPEANFSPAELDKFPRVTGILTSPGPQAGVPWDDGAVRGAALIADAFGEEWHPMGLAEIFAVSRRTTRGIQSTYVLVTVGGTKIPWGTQPLPEEPSSGLSADEKVAKLRDHISQHGSLDGVAQQADDGVRKPRTAYLIPGTRFH